MTVVSDTSVVLNLCVLGKEQLLSDLFGEVLAPPEVKAEFERLVGIDPRFKGLSFPIFIAIASAARIPPGLSGNRHLHPGELAAVSLADELHADAVLLDDKAARSAAAELGITVVGLVGILLQAKFAGMLPEVSPLLGRLESEAKFRLGPFVREEILRRAGEAW